MISAIEEKAFISDSKFIKQKKYWVNKLSGDIKWTESVVDLKKDSSFERKTQSIEIVIPDNLSSKLMSLSKHSDISLYIIFLAALKTLIFRYTGREDIIVISPIYKLNESEYTLNDHLWIRDDINAGLTYKELILKIRQTVLEAYNHQDYPFDQLIEYLFDPPLREMEADSGIVCLLNSIHKDRNWYIKDLKGRLVFSMETVKNLVKGNIFYKPGKYDEYYISQISKHFVNILENGIENIDIKISEIPILSKAERGQLIWDFNNTTVEFPGNKSIIQQFEQQVEQTPDTIAILYDNQHFTYRQLNENANRLARILRKRGVQRNQPVGILLARTSWMAVSILAVWKAGAAYIPLDTEYPLDRIRYILEECQASMVLTETGIEKKYSFSDLLGIRSTRLQPYKTAHREQITDFDSLPIPDRSYVDYEKYNKYIGLALVKASISLQTTRGCPYKCFYCHKIWPKNHVSRSAENVFDEVQLYYNMGVRRFSFFDDIFNLNKKNSARFFELIIKNNLDVKFVFSNGVRADILTKEYIDLMIEAGTMTLAFPLETASPRLQKLIGKNLNLEKFRENLEYTVKKYPHVICDLFTMHGFPTETEEEAMMTLNFIKSIKWPHFPSIAILIIYPDTDMEKLAIEKGISREAIYNSTKLAFHELPDTLPFDKSFTLQYQTDFFNSCFILKERLLHVIPYQMKVLTEDEFVQKYNSYLPVDINNFDEFLEFVGITKEELGVEGFIDEDSVTPVDINTKIKKCFPAKYPAKNALRILFLDISQYFTGYSHILYDVVEAPLGLMSVLTYLNQEFGDKINGKIAKSRIDFDSFEELIKLVKEFKPDLIGIRTLTFYKDFFHKSIALLRQAGIDVPIISGGPHSTSSYAEVLQDHNIDLVVLGEGEATAAELVGKIIKNNGKMPEEKVLNEIPGIAFIPHKERQRRAFAQEVVLIDELSKVISNESTVNLIPVNQPSDLAYIIYTSGSTGNPKGVMVEHIGMMNHIHAKINDLQISGKSIVAQNASPTFDISVWQFFAALAVGGKTAIYPDDLLLEPHHFILRATKDQLTILEIVPSYLAVILESLELKPRDFKFLRYLLVTGETVNPNLVKRWFETYPMIKMVNAYGPTEASDDITHYMMDKAPDKKQIPIGKPLQNFNIYVVDENMKLCPIGVKGEIYVSGIGVGKGYLNNQEKTRKAFMENPFVKENGTRLYKTGDIGRWLPDGILEFFGRKDYQVKIRGFRIELGEVEGQLMNDSRIKEAVVIDRENEQGEKYMCAYLVGNGNGEINISKIRESLLKKLPEYMIPTYIVELEQLPLTLNGKVDRRALPSPEIKSRGLNRASWNRVEKKLSELWSEVLGISKDSIGIDSNFFELGGNSLRAVNVLSKINRELDIEVPIGEFFDRLDIKSLAEFIKERNKQESAHSPVEVAEKKEYYPLSSAQKRLYIIQQMEATNISYNTPLIVVLEGNLDIRRLEAVFASIIERHESLRTSFTILDREPIQKIHGDTSFEIEYVERDEEEAKNLIKRFVRPFDLGKIPLLRVGLIKVADNKHILILDMHHIITDAVSMQVFVEDFMALYDGDELAALKLQYKDYSEWKNSEGEKGKIMVREKYWLNRFKGEIPQLNLPTDYARSTIEDFAGSMVPFEISKEKRDILKTIETEEQTTLFMVLLAIFYILLSRLCSQEDIIIGTPVVGRRHVDLERIIGTFVNMLALRNNIGAEKSFREFLGDVREKTLEAFENQDYPLEELVEKVAVNRDVKQNPLFDVVFSLHNNHFPEIKIPEIDLKPYQLETKISHFDLLLHAVETNGSLMMSLEYSTALFKRTTIEKMKEYYITILNQVLEFKEIKLKEIKISQELITANSNILLDKYGDYEF